MGVKLFARMQRKKRGIRTRGDQLTVVPVLC